MRAVVAYATFTVLANLCPAVRSAETEIDFDYLMKQEARTLIMAFYLILFLFPVGRWLVYRYTAKIASASQAYLDSLSAKVRARQMLPPMSADLDTSSPSQLSEAKGGIANVALKAKVRPSARARLRSIDRPHPAFCRVRLPLRVNHPRDIMPVGSYGRSKRAWSLLSTPAPEGQRMPKPGLARARGVAIVYTM